MFEKTFRVSVLLTLVSLGTSLRATPSDVIFLRHAEKPATGPELNEQGQRRAQVLVTFFKSDPRIQQLPKIAVIFSAKPQKEGGSVRSIQTMEPTSRAMEIPMRRDILRDNYKDMVTEIMTDSASNGKTVVICWEHKKIPEMLKIFGWNEGPSAWPDDVYDRVWILHFEGDHPARLANLPQRLLEGDSKE